MKQTIRPKKRKRTTFLRILARNAAAALVLSGIGALFLRDVGTWYIHSNMQDTMEVAVSNFQNTLNRQETDPEMLDLKVHLSSYYAIDLPFTSAEDSITPDMEGCRGAAAILDMDGNPVYTSEENMLTIIRFSEDDKCMMALEEEWLQSPEIDHVRHVYDEQTASDPSVYTTYRMDSAYVNRETHRFIPHVIEVVLWQGTDESPLESVFVEINPDVEGFELLTFQEYGQYPRNSLLGFWGSTEDYRTLIQDPHMQERIQEDSYTIGGYYGDNDVSGIYYSVVKFRQHDEDQKLVIVYELDAWNPVTKRIYFTFLGIVSGGLLLLALVSAWARNVKNQAEYAFEDRQTALTNSLAHDLKTPLTAIAGYAENMLAGAASPEEQQRYLHAIMDNVTHTDTIIMRTLELNRLEEARSGRKEPCDLLPMLEKRLHEYAVLLEERNLSVNTTGAASVKADPALLETILDNLLSNAVAYTPQDGTIGITLTDHRLTMQNTVTKQIDTTELKRPFITGDAARSRQTGSGLGLSIADAAANAQGFRLTLQCSDNAFTAMLHY